MSQGSYRRRGLPAWAAVLVLAACASAPAPPPPPAAPATAAKPRVTPVAPARAVDDFERAQAARAAAAEQQGRLAEAEIALEALTALRPQRQDYAERLRVLHQRIERAAAEAVARGLEEQRRGDVDRAARSFLQALALRPGHAVAAEALRAIERERNQRNFVGRFARNTLRLVSKEGTAPPAPISPSDSTLVEHASLLASQGEIDAAIGLAAKPAEQRQADPLLRRLVADLYFRKAQSLEPQRRGEVIDWLQRSLKLDPEHGPARERLQQLRGATAPAKRARGSTKR
jgi:tetratricopeptide (TPR) repeat protein